MLLINLFRSSILVLGLVGVSFSQDSTNCKRVTHFDYPLFYDSDKWVFLEAFSQRFSKEGDCICFFKGDYDSLDINLNMSVMSPTTEIPAVDLEVYRAGPKKVRDFAFFAGPMFRSDEFLEDCSIMKVGKHAVLTGVTTFGDALQDVRLAIKLLESEEPRMQVIMIMANPSNHKIQRKIMDREIKKLVKQNF